MKTDNSKKNSDICCKDSSVFAKIKISTLGKPGIMPIDLCLKNKMVGTIQEDATGFKPSGWDPVYVLLAQNPNAAPKRRAFGLLPPDPYSPCFGACCKILGAAQYRIEAKALICSKLVSDGHGPLMVLALAKLAHDKALGLVAEGPFSAAALTMLRRLAKNPIDNLSVQEHPVESFAITYTPNTAVETAFALASARLATHLQRPAIESLHSKWHVESELAELCRMDRLVKAAEAHH